MFSLVSALLACKDIFCHLSMEYLCCTVVSLYKVIMIEYGRK